MRAFSACALLVSLIGGAASTMGACGADGDGSILTPTGSGGSGTGASSSQGGQGGINLGDPCDPPCTGPQFCSVTGVCIDEGTCRDDGDCGIGAECQANNTCSGCNPPNLLIVLDRSCSMTSTVGNQSKWQLAVDAINLMTTDFAGQIRFGLSLFPDRSGGNCTQDAIAVPVGPDNETAIQTLLTNALSSSDPNFPDGPCVTNIDTAMEQAATEETAFDDNSRPGYVLLITDGKQYGCNAAGGDSGTTQIITTLRSQKGVGTFVLGFGNGVDPAQLNEFASVGGVPANDTSCTPTCQYYKAEDGATLQTALDTIASTIGCDPEVN